MKKNSIRARLMASTIAGSAALLAAAAIPAVALIAPGAAMAQDYTSGVLSGNVADATGTPVASASITVTSAQGTVRSTTTDADGQFRMPALPIGPYEVTIEGDGFATSVQRASVSPGGATYNFILPTAGASDSTDLGEVVVTAQRVQDFNATDTGLSVDVQEFAERVPVGRSINAVTLFAPGASAPDASINASSRRNQSLVSLSGTSAAESVYYINGLNVTDQRSFLGYGELPFDFIQTIDTKTGGYSAEYGRATGGVVNIVICHATRSRPLLWFLLACLVTIPVEAAAQAAIEPGFGEDERPPAGPVFQLPAGLEIAGPIMGANDDGDCPKPSTAAVGSGLWVRACLPVKNLTGGPVTVIFPPGLVLVSASEGFQNGLLVEREVVVVPPTEIGGPGRLPDEEDRRVVYIPLHTYCINEAKEPSTSKATFQLGPVSAHRGMGEIYRLLEDKEIAGNRDPVEAIQGAVNDILSDGAISEVSREFVNEYVLGIAADDG